MQFKRSLFSLGHETMPLLVESPNDFCRRSFSNQHTCDRSWRTCCIMCGCSNNNSSLNQCSPSITWTEIRAGTGKTPTINSPCDCHYSGTLIDGTEFDSSYKRGKPLTFAPNQVIPGWTQAMQLMKEGGKWELYIPSELAYGDNGAGASIPGGAALIFELELLSVKGDYVKDS